MKNKDLISRGDMIFNTDAFGEILIKGVVYVLLLVESILFNSSSSLRCTKIFQQTQIRMFFPWPAITR